MKRNHILLILGLFFLATSCIKPDDVQLGNVESFRVVSVGGTGMNVEADVRVTNLSGKNIALTAAKLTIARRGAPFMELLLRDKVVVPRRSSGLQTLPLVVRFEGIAGMLSAGTVLASGMKDCTIDVEATLRGGWAKKTFRIENKPVEDLLRQAGIDPVEFFKSYQNP